MANVKQMILKELAERAKAGDTLAMDTASRMQRAKEQGASEQTFFHATKGDFDEFLVGGTGETTAGELYGRGIYTSKNPEVAAGFVSGEGSNIIPLKTTGEFFGKDSKITPEQSTRINEYINTNSPELMARFADFFGVKKQRAEFSIDTAVEGRKLFNESKQMVKDAGFPDRYKPKTSTGPNGEIFVDYVDPNDVVDFGSKDTKDFINNLTSSGQSSEILSDLGYQGLDYSDTERLIFDPKNIRSVNAAFDPAKRESSNLLAGIGALGAGTTAALYTPEQNRAMSGELERMGFTSTMPDDVTDTSKFPGLDRFAAGLESATMPSQNINPMTLMGLGGAGNPLMWLYGAMQSESPLSGVTNYLTNLGAERSTQDRLFDAYGAALDIIP